MAQEINYILSQSRRKRNRFDVQPGRSVAKTDESSYSSHTDVIIRTQPLVQLAIKEAMMQRLLHQEEAQKCYVRISTPEINTAKRVLVKFCSSFRKNKNRFIGMRVVFLTLYIWTGGKGLQSTKQNAVEYYINST